MVKYLVISMLLFWGGCPDSPETRKSVESDISTFGPVESLPPDEPLPPGADWCGCWGIDRCCDYRGADGWYYRVCQYSDSCAKSCSLDPNAPPGKKCWD